MTLEQRFHLRRIRRFCAWFGKRHVDVVVNQHDETDFGREVDETIERLVLETRHFARDFRGNKFLMNGEFTDAREHARERREHTSNVIGGVHVGRIETGDHRIEPCLLFF